MASDAPAPASGSGWRQRLADLRPRDWRAWAWVEAGLLAPLLCLGLFPRWQPYYFEINIDTSYGVLLARDFADGRAWGREVVSHYGPYGFLYWRLYQPEVRAWELAGGALLALVFAVSAFRAVRRGTANPLVGALWLCAFAAMTWLPPDAFFFTLAAFYLALFFTKLAPADGAPPSLGDRIEGHVLAAALGWTGLVKFSFLCSGLACVVFASTYLACRRRAPWHLATYLASLLCFWLLAGQAPGDLPAFFSACFEIARGFGDALGTEPDLVEMNLFALGAVLWLGAVALQELPRRGAWALFPWLGWAALLALIFKAGLVRSPSHTLRAFTCLAAIALLAPACWPLRTGPAWRHLPALAACVLSLTGLNYTLEAKWRHTLSQHLGKGAETLRQGVEQCARVLAGADTHREAYAHHLNDLRARHPLPEIQGDVDLYPLMQGLLVAHGMERRTRPINQSFQAYTPGLAERNAAFLRGPDAPSTVLFDLDPVDGRLPALDDALSLPEILTRYDLRGRAEQYARFERLPEPRWFEHVPLAEREARFGEWIPVPWSDEAPIWARLEFEPTLGGRVLDALWRRARLNLELTYGAAEGPSRAAFRIVPGCARAGFLLSPLLDANFAVGLLTAPAAPGILQGRRVRQIMIRPVGVLADTPGFQPAFKVSFHELRYPPQPGAGSLPEVKAASLNVLVDGLEAGERPWFQALRERPPILQVTPAVRMSVALRRGPHKVRIGAGLLTNEKPEAGRMSFRLSYRTAAGARTVLVETSRVPEGRAEASEPAWLEAEFRLDAPARLEFSTESATPHAPLLGYWTELEIE
ncbi:MAG: hypothetical protein M5U26_20360 [Planctomycetota bacterium]|nr:hypothetical protein [Planctomycetota bacterium]